MNQQHRSPSRPKPITETYKNTNDHKACVSVTAIPVDKSKLTSTTTVIPSDTRENREPILFIWLDLQSQSTPAFIGSLRVINDCVRTYIDASTCFEALRTSTNNIFLISSSSNEELMLKLHAIDSIEAIFVLDPKANPIENRYPKLAGVFKQHEELTQSLKEMVDKYQQIQLGVFTFERENGFLWLQLWREEVMTRKVPANNKNDFLEMARNYYRNNPGRARLVDDFDRTYRAKDALRWCFHTPFPSNLLRHAFMFYDSDQLALCQFLITDASRIIQEQPKRTGHFQLYRGMKLPNRVVDQFETHTGKLVCASDFIICTKSRTIALELASSPGYRCDLSSILFKIECDVPVKFAELSIENRPPMSIFDVGTTFRIVCFNRGAISVVKMKAVSNEGKRLALEYKDSHREISVKILLDQLRAQPGQPSSAPRLLNTALSKDELEAEGHVKTGQIDLAIAVYQRVHPVSTAVLLRLGQLYADNKGDYENALNYYKQAMKTQEKTGEDTSDTITRIGTIHHERREFDSALTCHACALRLRESAKPPNLASIATNLVGISNAHRANNELSEALNYAKRALTIRESIVPLNETSVGTTLATLANIYFELDDDSDALQMGMRAFDIFKRTLPPNSTELAGLLNNLGAIRLRQGEIPEARQYFEQSIHIYRQIFPSTHPYIAKLENNIRCVSQMQ